MKYGCVYQPAGGKFRPRHKKSYNKLKTIFLIVGLFAFSYYVMGVILQVVESKKADFTIISPIAVSVSASIETVQDIFHPSKLDQIVSATLKDSTGTYAVAIKNLKTGESYYLNQDKKFETASLYKLWVMALSYQLIEQGKLDPHKQFDKDIAELNEKFNIASEAAELTDGKFTLEVKDALSQMIAISHNYSALALTQEVGLKRLEQFVRDNGFTNSRVQNPPLTSAKDMESFYEKPYSGQFGNKNTTEQMIALLKSQQINDRLPKYLPTEIDLAHKTGELDSFKHDAGIVFTPLGDYVIVILSDSKDPDQAAEREALLSKAVYEYFEKK